MTKKRKIRSTLPSKSKSQFLRAFVVAAMGIVVAVGFGAASTAQAATINVPAEYATIQEAVDSADPGDTIMVAPGEYAGAEIWKPVKIIGSGTSTSVTTSAPTAGAGFLISHSGAGTEISSLAVDVPHASDNVSQVKIFEADNCIVRDLKVTARAFGIASLYSDNTVVADNEISGGYQNGLNFHESSNAVVTGNTISGTWQHAVWIYFSPNATVNGNTISGDSSYGIRSYVSPNAVVRNNTVSGTIWSSIDLIASPDTDITANTLLVIGAGGISLNWASNNTTVKQNTIQNFHCLTDWGAPIAVQMSSNCIVTNNTLIDVYDPDNYAKGKGPIAGIRITGYGTWWYPCTNNIIQGNDYKKSGLPGWNKNHPTGPGCVVLEADWWGAGYGAPIDNYVNEDHHAYPAGTTICEQILDMTATPENPDGENTEVGMETCPEVSDYIDRLRDQAEREREEQELQEEEQLLLELLGLE